MKKSRVTDRNVNSYFFAFTEDEVTFMKTIEKYKRENRRPFPTWSEIHEIAISLGYRKETADKPIVVESKKESK